MPEKRQLDKASEAAQKGKDTARQDKIDNPVPPVADETIDEPLELEGMEFDQLLEVAVEYEVDATGLNGSELMEAIKRSAGYKVDDPAEDNQEEFPPQITPEEAADLPSGQVDEPPADENAAAEPDAAELGLDVPDTEGEGEKEQDSPTPEIPSKSAVIKLRHGQLYALANGLSIKLPTDPNEITRGEMITAILKIKGK